jgi:hypothetical protein
LWLYFNLRSAGSVVVTTSYTYSASPLRVWLGPGHCTYELSIANQCPTWYIRSFSGENPRVVSQSLAAGEYTVVLENFSGRAELVSFQVVFTSYSGTSASSGVASDAHWVIGPAIQSRH